MSEKRGFFEKIFGNRTDRKVYQLIQSLNGYTPIFSEFNGEMYDSDIVRAAVHAIASNSAKLRPRHIRKLNGTVQSANNSAIQNMLQNRPNPYMSAFDFYYKLVTQLMMKNNAFVYVAKDGMGNITGLFPVDFSTVELVELDDGTIAARFRFRNGRTVVLEYTELIHLRRYFYKHDFYGEQSAAVLRPTLELINTTNQGIINAVKTSAFLRGILKFSNTLRPEDLKKQRDDFMSDFMATSNNNGVAAVDSKAEFISLNNDPKMVNSTQMKEIREMVYRFFNINEAIVTSNYNEDQWNAFYESVIEPIAIQLSLEFTAKLFSQREHGFGNEIIFEANRLQYASTKTKMDLREMVDRGALTPNEWREVFNLGPVDGGDRPLRRKDTGLALDVTNTGGENNAG